MKEGVLQGKQPSLEIQVRRKKKSEHVINLEEFQTGKPRALMRKLFKILPNTGKQEF